MLFKPVLLWDFRLCAGKTLPQALAHTCTLFFYCLKASGWGRKGRAEIQPALPSANHGLWYGAESTWIQRPSFSNWSKGLICSWNCGPIWKGRLLLIHKKEVYGLAMASFEWIQIQRSELYNGMRLQEISRAKSFQGVITIRVNL